LARGPYEGSTLEAAVFQLLMALTGCDTTGASIRRSPMTSPAVRPTALGDHVTGLPYGAAEVELPSRRDIVSHSGESVPIGCPRPPISSLTSRARARLSEIEQWWPRVTVLFSRLAIVAPYRQQTCVRLVAQIRGGGPSPSPANILRTRVRRSSKVLGHSSALTALGMSR